MLKCHVIASRVFSTVNNIGTHINIVLAEEKCAVHLVI